MGLFSPPATGIPIVDRALRLAADALDRLEARVVSIVNVKVGERIGMADTRVLHGLRRPPRGYIIIRRDVDSVVRDGDVPSPSPAEWITLAATVPVVVDILFL